MYQNVFCDKKNQIVYLWDDEHGMTQFPMANIRYAYRRSPGGKYKSLYGDELEKVSSFDERDPTLFESDVSPEMRVLIDAYDDSDEPSKGHRVVIIDIEVSTEGGYPDVTKGDKPITAIALYDQAGSKYYSYVLDPDKKITDSDVNGVETRSFKDEEKLIEAFLNKWEEIQPTIVSGWNSNGFDIPYIFNRSRAVLGKQAGYRLSPIGIAYQNKFSGKMIIAGVSCLGYDELYKKFLGVMKSSYSLANVAKDEELKVQKLVYRGSLNDLYKNDLHRYVEYNLTDVKVVVELDKKYDFIYLARSVCHKGHVPYEWFRMSSRFIDGAILTYLKRHNMVAPNKPVGGREEYEEMEREGEEGFEGAYVKEPIPGLYNWVCSADITSLYPSTIISLNISPETKISKIDGWDKLAFERGEIPLIKVNDRSYTSDEFEKMISGYVFAISSNGVVYRQDVLGVVPTILDLWFKERVEYRELAKKYGKEGDKEKEEFYDRRQKRQKIFLNSVYGVLGLPVFRFYDRDNAEAVTLSGQAIIKGTEKVVNDYLNKKLNTPEVDHIIAADTDSNYFSLDSLAKLNNIPADKLVQFYIDTLTEISDKINRYYQYMVPRIFNVALDKNRIKIVPDVIAKKALWVSKKHYALLKVYDMEKKKPVKDKNGDEGKLEIKGIDVVRSAFPAAFRKFLGEILDQILRGTPREILDEKIMKFEESLDIHTMYDLAKTTSVNFISRNGEHDYDPDGRKIFQFVSGSPAQVRAALSYNDLLKVWKLDKRVEKIKSGEKVKWVYLIPNDFFIEGLAMKADDTDPDQILEFITNNIDRKKMYMSELYSKLREIYSAVKWHMPNRASELASKTFDFNEAW